MEDKRWKRGGLAPNVVNWRICDHVRPPSSECLMHPATHADPAPTGTPAPARMPLLRAGVSPS